MASDKEVATALWSDHHTVVVEAPAGCGKTYQAAAYAERFINEHQQRVLVLTHTHAARQVFNEKRLNKKFIDVRTLDSLSMEIARNYHLALDLPLDTYQWAVTTGAFDEVSKKVADLLEANPYIADSLAARYKVLIADEHQDASTYQHRIVRALARSGIKTRIFGDPMQQIYNNSKQGTPPWEIARDEANHHTRLQVPHRWNANEELGHWILQARDALKSGGQVDLCSAPASVTILDGSDSIEARGALILGKETGKALRGHIAGSPNVWILAPRSRTVGNTFAAVRHQSFKLWEGSVRDHLEPLFEALELNDGNPYKIGEAIIKFLDNTSSNFTRNFQTAMMEKIENPSRETRGANKKIMYDLAQYIIDEPNHFGVSMLLNSFPTKITRLPWKTQPKINHQREFNEACRIGDYQSVSEARLGLTRHRTHFQPQLPARGVSTIHKAKGLEFEEIVIIDLRASTFPDRTHKRALLYTALSRATNKITLVISKDNVSPLIKWEYTDEDLD